jgi:hypothetical protein
MDAERGGVILTSELDSIARQGLNDVRAVFAGQMDEATLEKANMAIKLLRISSGRYSAETNRMALAFRLARALEVPNKELVPLWRQLSGASRAQKAIGAASASGSGKDGD